MLPPRRKKWTEAEEKTLIDKYGDLASNGTLAKMKTREKKFKPVACYVNSVHHLRDPAAYPWNWTWKDVSTKVQNMRHQWLLVKQKIKRPPTDTEAAKSDDLEEFDWMEGLTYWSNFLRYKEVFGDVGLVYGSNEGHDSMVGSAERKNGRFFIGGGRECPQMGNSVDGDFGADIEGGVELGFEYDGGGDLEKNYDGSDNNGDDGFVIEDVDRNGSSSKKKSKSLKKLEKRAWGFITKQLWQLRDMEAQYERSQEERERDMQRRENHWVELEKEWERKLEERERQREERAEMRDELRKKRVQEWEAMERENAERERIREEELIEEREWEERLSRRRVEWNKRINERLNQHRAEMNQLQTRIIHDQQNLTSQLLGLVSQWTGHATGFSDHSGAGNPYLSQVMQNLHHVNGIVHGDTGVDDGNQDDDQFIVDG